jgi:hypothetical protein
MSDEQLNLLEQLSNISLFEEDKACELWKQLLDTKNVEVKTNLDQKNIRVLFSHTKQFADCTQITP